jgi:SAM-dependent methyltransferase
MRKVGTESRKTYKEKLENGFFDKYMSGIGLDIGYKGYEENIVPILESAQGIDLETPGYDGRTLPFEDNSLDYVYSSHCLEHISDYKNYIKEALRVLKPGGYIITVVPHRDLYEKKLTLPSQWNGDHKRFYTSASLCKEFEESLPINSYRIRHLHENDAGHKYDQPENEHSVGQYEIELVVQKL